MISARVALERLRAGNHRFATNTEDRTRLLSHARRAELAKQQWPFAIDLIELSPARSTAFHRTCAYGLGGTEESSGRYPAAVD
jgi:hypothetical protein